MLSTKANMHPNLLLLAPDSWMESREKTHEGVCLKKSHELIQSYGLQFGGKDSGLVWQSYLLESKHF